MNINKDTYNELIIRLYGSNHSNLQEKLCKYNADNLVVISNTDREVRPNETNGIEHIFITKDAAIDLLQKRNPIAKTEINGNLYFVLEEDLHKKLIYIIDPNGINSLKSSFIADKYIFKTIYIEADMIDRINRAANRGDSPIDFYKRTISEDKQFKKFEEDLLLDGSLCDLVINTSESSLVDNVWKCFTFMEKELCKNKDKKPLMFLVAGRTNAGKDTIVTFCAALLELVIKLKIRKE